MSFASALFAADEAAKKSPTTAQALELARRWLDAQRAYDEIPGMSAAIVHDQKAIWSGGSGFADPETKRPATADTLYSICSVSKLFTSIGVMQLRDQGKLSIDDPVSKHLSWFRMKPAEEGREATVRGILTHSSGLPRESDFPYWTGDFDFPTREKIMERVQSQEALYPSERYLQYSNLGLALAGEIVSAVSKMPYDQYVRQNILQPIGMQSTYPEIPIAEKGKRFAVGYTSRRRDGTRAPLPLFQTRGIAPAAGFASTANDLARFASWHFRVLSGAEKNVLDPRTLREMQRAHWVEADLESFWGLGYSTWKEDGKVFVGHGGSCPGFRTSFALKPDEKVGVVVMANAGGINIGRYARALYEIVAPTLKGESKASDANPALAAYTGSYDSSPWAGEVIVVPWGDDLGFVSLPTMDPAKDLQKFRKTGEHRFRRVRKDGALGETVVFEIGPDGRATRFWQHSNPYPRMGE